MLVPFISILQDETLCLPQLQKDDIYLCLKISKG